tara:strand:+ start:3113 stop:3418 length:306 start_codon:yes stop_codon:yes gene_type:complete
MSNVIKFPNKRVSEPTGYRINLYTEDDIAIVLTCLNLSDDMDDQKKWVRKDLRTMEPEHAINKMKDCLESPLLSDICKKNICRIINSVEVLPLSKLYAEFS